jgi:hypothetical protein
MNNYHLMKVFIVMTPRNVVGATIELPRGLLTLGSSMRKHDLQRPPHWLRRAPQQLVTDSEHGKEIIPHRHSPHPAETNLVFNFSYVCPEPVLASPRILVSNGATSTSFPHRPTATFKPPAIAHGVRRCSVSSFVLGTKSTHSLWFRISRSTSSSSTTDLSFRVIAYVPYHVMSHDNRERERVT